LVPPRHLDGGTDAPLERRDARFESRPDVAADARIDAGADARIDAGADSGRNLPDAARDGVCVPLGAVAFRMQAPATDAGYQYVFSLGNPGDGVWWYSVETPDGAVLPIFLPSGAPSTCERCEDGLTPIGQGCGALPDGGVSGGWGGYAVTGAVSCEVPASSFDPAHQSLCATIDCLPAGRYTVKMCAVKGGCYSASGQNTCLSIPFDFPGTSEVVGTLPP
jgi:hypothetical protein